MISVNSGIKNYVHKTVLEQLLEYNWCNLNEWYMVTHITIPNKNCTVSLNNFLALRYIWADQKT